MRHFLILPTPFFFLVKAKRKKKIHCISQIEAKLNLMIDEKAYADFTITRVPIFSFGGFIHTKCA